MIRYQYAYFRDISWIRPSHFCTAQANIVDIRILPYPAPTPDCRKNRWARDSECTASIWMGLLIDLWSLIDVLTWWNHWSGPTIRREVCIADWKNWFKINFWAHSTIPFFAHFTQRKNIICLNVHNNIHKYLHVKREELDIQLAQWLSAAILFN